MKKTRHIFVSTGKAFTMACILLNPQVNLTRRSHSSQHAVVAIQPDCFATKHLKAVISSIHFISFLNFFLDSVVGVGFLRVR